LRARKLWTHCGGSVFDACTEFCLRPYLYAGGKCAFQALRINKQHAHNGGHSRRLNVRCIHSDTDTNTDSNSCQEHAWLNTGSRSGYRKDNGCHKFTWNLPCHRAEPAATCPSLGWWLVRPKASLGAAESMPLTTASWQGKPRTGTAAVCRHGATRYIRQHSQGAGCMAAYVSGHPPPAAVHLPACDHLLAACTTATC
jgi:hypothetical protein